MNTFSFNSIHTVVLY